MLLLCAGYITLPQAVREHFLDEHAEATPDGKLWAQPTQCLTEEGDVIVSTFWPGSPSLRLCARKSRNGSGCGVCM